MRAYILSENGSERVPEPKPEPEVELKTEPDLEPVEEAQKITSATLPKMAKQFGVVTNQSTTPGTGACAEKGSNWNGYRDAPTYLKTQSEEEYKLTSLRKKTTPCNYVITTLMTWLR